ncbi:uncharacterized protein LACBIDRAFT_321184 [Laccaria bicolor S238N-H82]|uniref:Predicted protein n=1 Tax=Laccaria bicolor (strain S238N-H82 / ATCC MYA-4686) TaxID=486041 RepID=B0CP06_LACBS|nr:uncharacterized protein LACBIDRAFT_321184 [Laccaria bicolor S238N-H82]EDR16029.1 predicted protein [Laccaria bicolor S238N-H82]|eukprot:XP_001874237.1 predicted protein [Laccaria bicolor S238N-H82]
MNGDLVLQQGYGHPHQQCRANQLPLAAQEFHTPSLASVTYPRCSPWSSAPPPLFCSCATHFTEHCLAIYVDSEDLAYLSLGCLVDITMMVLAYHCEIDIVLRASITMPQIVLISGANVPTTTLTLSACNLFTFRDFDDNCTG